VIDNKDKDSDPVSELMRRRKWRQAARALSAHLEDESWTPRLLERLVICLTNAGLHDAVLKLAADLRERPFELPRSGHHTHGLAFLHRPPDNPHEDFLFVSGAPRSGTSTLGAFLSWHPGVVMLTERYRPYLGYHPNMFKRWAVYHGNHIHKNAAQHNSQRGKFNAAKWIGDKRPNFAYGLPFTIPNFADRNLVILHIVRNPYDVCWSYDHLSASTDYFSAGHKFACDEINANNQALLCHARRFQVIDFAKLYEKANGLFAIYEHLGLDISNDLRAHTVRFYERNQKALNRRRALDKETRRHVEDAIDWSAHHQLLAQAI